jgi:hypothetical protein
MKILTLFMLAAALEKVQAIESRVDVALLCKDKRTWARDMRQIRTLAREAAALLAPVGEQKETP